MSSISETRLKPVVHWVEHPNFWILRNPEDITYIQVEDDFNKSIIDDIDTLNLPLPLPAIVPAIAEKYELTRTEVNSVIQHLRQTGMLIGTKPPKPSKRKWTPLDLLYMRFSLINPDTWLSNNVKYLEWIWTRTTGCILLTLLVFTSILAIDSYSEILKTGKLVLAQGNGVIIPFILLTCLVVSLHELAHAFTLKHYKGLVPDMGVFLMLLIPACYTNTSDSYPLRRHQQVLVIAAGIICQIVMSAIGLLLWHFSDPSAEIHTIAYLLMVTGLITLAINLNPLSGGFDGYHLAVAITGINNLRSRSRLFYLQLLKRQPLDEEDKHIRSILTIYAPLSLAYILFVFTFLIWAISSWTWLNIPAIAFTLFILWVVYFFAPTPNFKFMNNSSSSSAESRSNQPTANPNSSQSIDSPQFLPIQKRKFPILWISLALLGGAMFLPFPHQIGGKVELKTLRTLRSFVYNEQSMPCTVKQVFVNLGDEVNEGDNLVELTCRLLDENIAKTKDDLNKAQESLAKLKIEAIMAKVDSERKQSESQLALNEAMRSSRQEGETAQSQIARLGKEKERLQVLLTSAKIEYDRFLSLSKEGAVAGRDKDLAIRAYETAKKDLEVKELEILTFQSQLRDQEEKAKDFAELKVSEVDRSNEIYEAHLESARLTEMVTNLENRLREYEGKKKDLILKSKQNGTVYSKDNVELDILTGKELLPSDKPIMEIARTHQLVAKVQIDHRDTEFVKKNAKVQFRPDQAKHRIYEGIIEREPVNKEPDGSINQSNLTEVDIVIYNDNPDNPKLAPNATGYAKIYSKDMLVFQRIQLEFMRLIDSRFL